MQRKTGNKKGGKKAVLKAPNIKFGIVVSHYYEDITGSMLKGALKALHEAGVKNSRIEVLYVPGSFEIPYGCLALVEKKCKAIITLGCIIKGETEHDRHIASAVSTGIVNISIKHNVPITLGVITTNNLKQAIVRSTGKTNKGEEAAHAAIELSLL